MLTTYLLPLLWGCIECSTKCMACKFLCKESLWFLALAHASSHISVCMQHYLQCIQEK